MRIISGKFKGKKIIQPSDKNTRPLKDLAKESIFNLVKHSKLLNIDLKNSNILDLFSGTGSFGIECLSRGVKKVYFVENYKPILNILKKNVNIFTEFENYKIIEKNIFDKNLFNYMHEEFDIIFLDPPYKEKKIKDILELIYKYKILRSNGVIIIHRNRKTIDEFSNFFKIIEKRNYGISKIIFLTLR